MRAKPLTRLASANPGTRHWYGFAGDRLVVEDAPIARETALGGCAQRSRDRRVKLGTPRHNRRATVSSGDARRRTARISRLRGDSWIVLRSMVRRSTRHKRTASDLAPLEGNTESPTADGEALQPTRTHRFGSRSPGSNPRPPATLAEALHLALTHCSHLANLCSHLADKTRAATYRPTASPAAYRAVSPGPLDPQSASLPLSQPPTVNGANTSMPHQRAPGGWPEQGGVFAASQQQRHDSGDVFSSTGLLSHDSTTTTARNPLHPSPENTHLCSSRSRENTRPASNRIGISPQNAPEKPHL
ncbi:hypothetical protein P3T42_006110 [Paraburkholderia sp. GAS38]